jgi:hypothetical protein
MSAQQLGAHLGALGLDADALKTPAEQKLDGRALLGADSAALARAGLLAGDAIALLDFVAPLRSGGPKTVRVVLDRGAPDDVTDHAFDTQAELNEFLQLVGAAGLRDDDTHVIGRVKHLVNGALYTLEFAGSGGLKRAVDSVQRSLTSDALIVLARVESAIVEASEALFGERLTVDPRRDVPLKIGRVVYGDVDSRFTGARVHLLLERKRRLDGVDDTPSIVIAQMQTTRDAYMRLGLHIMDGQARRVEGMVFAEAMSAAAADAFLAAGFYVLRAEELRVLAPSAERAAGSD